MPSANQALGALKKTRQELEKQGQQLHNVLHRMHDLASENEVLRRALAQAGHTVPPEPTAPQVSMPDVMTLLSRRQQAAYNTAMDRPLNSDQVVGLIESIDSLFATVTALATGGKLGPHRSTPFASGGVVSELHHADHADQPWIARLLGLAFADPTLRREFGRPMTSEPGYQWLVWHEGDAVRGFAALKVGKKSGELCYSCTYKNWRRKGFNRWASDRRIAMAREAGLDYVLTIVKPAREQRYLDRGFYRYGQRGQYLTLRKDLLS